MSTWDDGGAAGWGEPAADGGGGNSNSKGANNSWGTEDSNSRGRGRGGRGGFSNSRNDSNGGGNGGWGSSSGGGDSWGTGGGGSGGSRGGRGGGGYGNSASKSSGGGASDWGTSSSANGGDPWGSSSGATTGDSDPWGSSGGGGGGGAAAARPDGWDCPSCQVNNYANRRQCFKCQTPNPNPPAGGGGARERRAGDWDCPSCSQHNFASKQQCFKCQTAKPEGIGSTGGGGGGGRERRAGDWDCPGCGQHVFASKNSCFKCQTPKPADAGFGGKRANEASGSTSWGAEQSNYGGSGEDSSRKRTKIDDESGIELREDGRPVEPYKPCEADLDEEAELQNNGAGENFFRYKEQTVTCLPPDAIKPIDKFEDLISSELLLQNVKSLKYTEMTPIQKWAMPAIVEGRDIIGCAQTGSGKTAAFLLPILQNLLKSNLEPNDPNSDCQYPYCLIIAPTRELVKQTYVNASMLAKDSILRCQYIYGQISTAHLKAELTRGCHILVATPGRLKDFVQRGWISFKNIRYVVMDEGDRLVDEGFNEDVRSFFNDKEMPSKLERQTLFFSATFKAQTQLNAKEYLKDDFLFLTVGRVGAANEDIRQEFLQVPRDEKKRELKKILAELPETEKTIIFTQTKGAADMLAGFFSAQNLSATSIHGDRHQYQREQAIRSFRKGEKRFLISSPVGNRGLDLPKVALVINYDLPSNVDEYVHRIGRTGRAGHTGKAISFFDSDRDMEIIPELLDILKEAKQDIPEWLDPTGGAPALTNGNGGGDAMEDDWGVDDAAPKTTADETTTASEEKSEAAPAAQVEVDEW